VKYLIGFVADISSKSSADYHGLTPLHGAIKQFPYDHDCLVIVRFLLESGVDPSALPSTGFPVLLC